MIGGMGRPDVLPRAHLQEPRLDLTEEPKSGKRTVAGGQKKKDLWHDLGHDLWHDLWHDLG
jgi:hypothetical protein